jgi:inhibitor of cysteine peptidase
MVFLKEEKMMSDYNLDPKEIKEKLVNELEDVKMDEKLEWRILGHYRSKRFAKKDAKRIRTKYLVGLAAAMCCILILTLGFFAYSQVTAFKMYLQNGVDNNKILLGIIPTVDSEARLVSLLKSNTNNKYYDENGSVAEGSVSKGVRNDIAAEAPQSMTAGQANGVQQDASTSSDYSKTNTQVEGVDEGDIVKTDGKYIYRLSNNQNITPMYKTNDGREVAPSIGNSTNPSAPNGTTSSGSGSTNPSAPDYAAPSQIINTNKLSIIEALPDGKLKLISEIKIDNNQMATEFYLDNSTISIIFNGGQAVYNGVSKQISQVMVYGIADITKPNLLKNYQIEGNYLSSRKIDNQIYLITNKYINYYNNGSETITSQIKPPVVCDNKADNTFTDISYSDVQYFPNETYQTYVSISSIDTNKPEQDAKITTYLSSGQNIYASLNNLYIANARYDYQTAQKGDIKTMEMQSGESMDILKFSLDNGNVVYKAKAEKIPGHILNQYSMDEYNGSFRIAVTANASALYIFDSNMKKTGEIVDMAAGEQIKSVRFMGDKGYVVTFRQTDPLFVIDLSKPAAPKVLGQLKIPGFSEYLHPYDENHIIGVGKSASETNSINGRVQGIKMSMFDVTDPVNPKEMFSRDIGEGLVNPMNTTGQNPKAFLFDKEKGIIALAVSAYDLTATTNMTSSTITTSPANPGSAVNPESIVTSYPIQPKLISYFHVYSVDLKDGFVLRAKLIANNPDDISIYGYQPEDARALYIKDKFFTTTGKVIKSFDYKTFNQIDSLNIVEQK